MSKRTNLDLHILPIINCTFIFSLKKYFLPPTVFSDTAINTSFSWAGAFTHFELADNENIFEILKAIASQKFSQPVFNPVKLYRFKIIILE